MQCSWLATIRGVKPNCVFASQMAIDNKNYNQNRHVQPKIPQHHTKKLPFTVLNPQSKLQKNGISCKKSIFPAEECTFLQKHALSSKKCLLLQKTAVFGHVAENCRKGQERVSGLKNRERQITFTREKSKRVFPSLPAWSVKKGLQKFPKTRKTVKNASKIGVQDLSRH